MSGGEKKGGPGQKEAARCWHTERPRKGGGQVYTDYGYEVDGIEYATLDEAVHRDDDD